MAYACTKRTVRHSIVSSVQRVIRLRQAYSDLPQRFSLSLSLTLSATEAVMLSGNVPEARSTDRLPELRTSQCVSSPLCLPPFSAFPALSGAMRGPGPGPCCPPCMVSLRLRRLRTFRFLLACVAPRHARPSGRRWRASPSKLGLPLIASDTPWPETREGERERGAGRAQ